MTRKIKFQPWHTKTPPKKWYFRTKFHFRKTFPSTFSEENGRAEVGEKNFNNTFVYDDDAQKVTLCTRSPFFYRWILLISKKTFLKIHLAIKSKNLKYKKHPHKKIKSTKLIIRLFTKKKINHILGRRKISLFTRLFMSRQSSWIRKLGATI